MPMPYQVTLKFGLRIQTKLYPTVNEARRSADKLASTYAARFGRATTTVFTEEGEEIYIRVRNAPTSLGHKRITE